MIYNRSRGIGEAPAAIIMENHLEQKMEQGNGNCNDGLRVVG